MVSTNNINSDNERNTQHLMEQVVICSKNLDSTIFSGSLHRLITDIRVYLGQIRTENAYIDPLIRLWKSNMLRKLRAEQVTAEEEKAELRGLGKSYERSGFHNDKFSLLISSVERKLIKAQSEIEVLSRTLNGVDTDNADEYLLPVGSVVRISGESAERDFPAKGTICVISGYNINSERVLSVSAVEDFRLADGTLHEYDQYSIPMWNTEKTKLEFSEHGYIPGYGQNTRLGYMPSHYDLQGQLSYMMVEACGWCPLFTELNGAPYRLPGTEKNEDDYTHIRRRLP